MAIRIRILNYKSYEWNDVRKSIFCFLKTMHKNKLHFVYKWIQSNLFYFVNGFELVELNFHDHTKLPCNNKWSRIYFCLNTRMHMAMTELYLPVSIVFRPFFRSWSVLPFHRINFRQHVQNEWNTVRSYWYVFISMWLEWKWG